jgi:hypothetical protein
MMANAAAIADSIMAMDDKPTVMGGSSILTTISMYAQCAEKNTIRARAKTSQKLRKRSRALSEIFTALISATRKTPAGAGA